MVLNSGKGNKGYRSSSGMYVPRVSQEADLFETFYELSGCSDAALCEFSFFFFIEKKYLQKD